jgi:DNA/RNA-binding domain of Phe-tRNA-synthetase-like protein
LIPYSPEFQPVELAFSKIKGMFRRLWPWDHGVEQYVETCTSLIVSVGNSIPDAEQLRYDSAAAFNQVL